jgi:Galactose oxidase, central domain
MQRILCAAIMVFSLVFRAGSGDRASAAGALKGAASNTWVKLHSFSTGGRAAPMFFYDAKSKKFYLSGGRPGGGYANAKRHFDTEIFDLDKAEWINAYPEGAPYKVKSGVTDAPAHSGWRKFFKPDKNGVSRIAMFGTAYGTASRAYYQWAYNFDSQKLVTLLHKQTAIYDIKTRNWQVTGAGRIAKGAFAMVWGSFCYDPLNKEIVSVGGSSAQRGGTPGTCVYKIAADKWEQLSFGSDEFNKLQREAEEQRRAVWGLITLCRNRYNLTETDSEGKAKLSASAAAIAKSVAVLAAKVKVAKLKGSEAAAAKVAVEKLEAAAATLKSVGAKLEGLITAELIAELRPAFEAAKRTERALDSQPTGRANSQMVFDAASGKIVLFGGSGLDRCLSDTWVYDVKTRKWEQRWPKIVPSPRQGHAMVYLPKSKRVVLIGGHTINGGFRTLAHQTWAYDTGKNEWKLVISLPARAKRQPANYPHGEAGGEPYAGASSGLVAAVTKDDVVVAISMGGKGRVTWAAKLEPAGAGAIKASEIGVKPGTISWSMRASSYDKVAVPEPGKMQSFMKGLKPNVWTYAPKIPKRPSWRAWNTTAYDPDRQQFLLWGGGHVTYMGTEISHYSVRSGLWNISYSPDAPHAPTGGFYVKASLSFASRPQVPVHAYQAYAYDPPSGKMFYLSRAYDVRKGEWDPEPYPGLKSSGCMKTLLETTPHGVFALSGHGLYKFEAKEKSWKKMPWNGPKFGNAWCDGHALCYDSKRDCLWMANSSIFKYDIKSGTVTKSLASKPAVLGKFALWREQVHIPEADLILLMRMFKSPDGKMKNVAWDPESGKYHFVELAFNSGGKTKVMKKNPFSWSQALHYDRKLKLVLLSTQREPIFLRFDRKTAKLKEIN